MMGDHVRLSGVKKVESLFYRRYSNGNFIKHVSLEDVLLLKRQKAC
jgi:hypothetical protein